jgi:protein-tyrosine kinase
MSSIIEQANRRLEELKRAGIEVPTWDMGQAQDAPAFAPAAPAKAQPAQSGQPQVGEAPSRRTRTAEVTARGAASPLHTPLNPPLGQGHSLVQVGQRQSKSVQIELAQLAAAGYLVPDSPRSQLADEFRGIKQPVLKNARADAQAPIRHGNLIMVTSALAGEGKTFCALNLALSIASEVDSSVLLIDADVVRPAVLGRLGLGDHYKGLLDLLTEPQLDLSEVILRTNVPKLSVIPAGTPRINATELLASSTMEQLLEDISSRYADRIVIFDAPPLLATTESRVLAERMGQILMVVAEGSTPREDLAKAFAALQACPIVLSMLNQSTSVGEQQQYGYY